MMKIINIILKLTIIKKNRIAIIEESFPSGSNTRVIYNELLKHPEYIAETTDLHYVDLRNNNNKLALLKKLIIISRAKVIISSQGRQKFKNSQFLINTWHGIPLKSMNRMENSLESYLKFKDDILITNSKLDSVLMSACTGIPFKKHMISRSPRLDYFSEENINLNHLAQLFPNHDKYDKIIIYLPTFRNGGYLEREEGNFTGKLFNFTEIDLLKFNVFLIENNILLFVKYHPSELKNLEILKNLSNIYHIDNDELEKNNLDLYNILPHTDMLITDYSSVFMDYLHLNKPMIFTPTDLKEYASSRGLLLEPYINWVPGEVATNQNYLEKAIIDNFKIDNYSKERDKLRKIFYSENTNSTREIIDIILENTKN